MGLEAPEIFTDCNHQAQFEVMESMQSLFVYPFLTSPSLCLPPEQMYKNSCPLVPGVKGSPLLTSLPSDWLFCIASHLSHQLFIWESQITCFLQSSVFNLWNLCCMLHETSTPIHINTFVFFV